MSYLSNQLRLLLEHRPGLSQVYLCEQTGISQPQMSRYFAGTNEPTAEGVNKICSVLPEPERAAVAAAFLRDRMPPSARDLVDIIIRAAARAAESDPEEPRRPMPKPLRQAFDYLERLAVENSAASDSILTTVRFLRGHHEPPAPSVRILEEEISPKEAQRRDQE